MSGILKIASFIVLSPVIGFLLGYSLGSLLTVLLQKVRPAQVDSVFRKGQLLSAAAYSLGHGTNDAQKTMGIIALLLFQSVWKDRSFTDIPFWIVLVCHAAMGLGTLIGGWRIVKTMGSKITKLNPFGGFCAETGAAVTLFATAAAGIPVSTTHTIAGSIVGFGTMRRSFRPLASRLKDRLGVGADNSGRRCHRRPHVPRGVFPLGTAWQRVSRFFFATVECPRHAAGDRPGGVRWTTDLRPSADSLPHSRNGEPGSPPLTPLADRWF